jgi:hypothetical protein
MSRSNAKPVTLLIGFVLTLAGAAVLLWKLGPENVITGTVWGIGVAYLGFLLFYFLIQRPKGHGTTVSLLRGYLPWALLRYVIMIGAFCAVVFWLRVNAIGVLLGIFLGMMASTFVSLAAMRRAPPKPPPEG